MQIACFGDLFEVTLDGLDAVLQHPAIEFDLRFTWAAEEAATAALPFQMGPGAHEAALLVHQMSELDLQNAFFGASARAEYFQNQTGAIDDLGIPGFFQITLLHRVDDMIDHNEADVFLLDHETQLFDLAPPKQRRGLWLR